MTWVKGTSTWQELEHLLTQLACGEVSDGSGTTVAAGSRWQRDLSRTVTDGVLNGTTTVTSATANFTSADVGAYIFATGVPLNAQITSVTNSTTVVLSRAATATASGVTLQIASNVVRTPASKDVNTGACANRVGYFANLGSASNSENAWLSASNPGVNSVCRLTSLLTGTGLAATTSGRVLIRLTVSTPNTTAGNYSTAVLSLQIYDPDAASGLLVNTTVNVNAAGVATVTGNFNFTVSVSDPSGLLTSQTLWVRAFQTGYTGGIDWWPMLHRASDTPAFSTAPPGVQATDWDVVTTVTTWANSSLAGGVAGGWERGGHWHGLGIKTLTGLGSGDRYVVSWNMALIKCRWFVASLTTSIGLSLDLGQAKRDPSNSPTTYRNVGGMRYTNWTTFWVTAAGMTATTALQYWASITADGIVLVVNADPAGTGRLGTGYLCAFTPAEPTYDTFPIQVSSTYQQYVSDNSGAATGSSGVQYAYAGLKRRQDGSEGRDWQTRWMRTDGAQHSPYAGSSPADATAVGGISVAGGSTSTPYGMENLGGGQVTTSTSVSSLSPLRMNKPGGDGKWTLIGATYGEGGFTFNDTVATERRVVRGFQTSRFAYIPEDGWGSGDELTDTATSTKWLLLKPDYAGMGHYRMRQTTNTFFGGVAIAEL